MNLHNAASDWSRGKAVGLTGNSVSVLGGSTQGEGRHGPDSRTDHANEQPTRETRKANAHSPYRL